MFPFRRAPAKIECEDHPAAPIAWRLVTEVLDNGRSVTMPHPYCEHPDHGEKRRRIAVESHELLREFGGTWGAPTPFIIRVAAAEDARGKRAATTTGDEVRPANGDPLGVTDLSDEPPRELILGAETAAALDRTRLHLERAPRIYKSRPGIKDIAQMRLTAQLHGPPGTGKTESFKRLTQGLFRRRVLLNARSLLGSYVGETDRNMNGLIAWVQTYAARPGELALLLDDADDFLTARSSDNSAAGQTLNAAKISMLRLFDEAHEVAIVVTTNRAAALDPAIDRRFKSHIYFPLPDEGMRQRLAHAFLARIGVAASVPQVEALAAAADGLSPAEMAGCVIDALVAADGADGKAVDHLHAEFTQRAKSIAEARHAPKRGMQEER